MAIEYGISDKITFSHPIGLQRDNTFIDGEVLLKAYKDKIGSEIQCNFGYKDYIITSVNLQGDFIFVECTKKVLTVASN